MMGTKRWSEKVKQRNLFKMQNVQTKLDEILPLSLILLPSFRKRKW